MKTGFKWSVIFAMTCLFFFSSCGKNEKKEINETAAKYLKALFKDADIKTAKEYATKESEAFLTIAERAIENAKNKEQARKEARDLTITIYEIVIDGNTATVDYFLQSKKKEEPVYDRLKMKKVDGKWLVHQAKESKPVNKDSQINGDSVQSEKNNMEEQPITAFYESK